MSNVSSPETVVLSPENENEFYILEAEEHEIPWKYLSNDDRYKILVRELTEHINLSENETFIRSISDMIGKIGDNIEIDKWDKIYNQPWIYPIVDNISNSELYITKVNKYIPNKNTVIVDNENITFSDLDINLNFINKPKNFNTVNYELNLRFYNVFKPQWNKYFSSTQFRSLNYKSLCNLVFNILNYYHLTRYNNTNFNEQQLIKAKLYFARLSKIKQTLPNEQSISFDYKWFQNLYGIYYFENTLSNTNLGKILFLWRNKYLRNILPYFNSIENKQILIGYEELVKLKKHIELIYYNYQNQQKQKQINQDIFEQAIANQLGQFILNKFINNKLQLSHSQLRLVERYIELQKTLRIQYKSNNCPHIPLRNQFDETNNLNEKKDIFQNLITKFGKNGFDPETKNIFCSNCGFNLACQHEVLMIIPKDEAKANTELVNDFYKTGEVIIECQYCGRKIEDIQIEMEIQFDENNQRILGNITEQETDDTIFLRNNINDVIIYAGISNQINPYIIINVLAGILFEKFSDIAKKEYATEHELILKRIQIYAYTWAYIATNQTLKLEMFKDISEAKEIRKIIFKRMMERDPRFINDLDRFDLKHNFVNAIARAQTNIQNSEFKNYKSILVAKKLFSYKLPEFVDHLKPNDLIELINLNGTYLRQVFMGMKPLYNRRYFKPKFLTLLKYHKDIQITKHDQKDLEKEIEIFLESACAGNEVKGESKEKIKWKNVNINCHEMNKTAEIIANKMIEKEKEHSKVFQLKSYNFKLEILDKKHNLIGDTVKLDKLIKYFGANFLIVKNFFIKISTIQELEIQNIIARLVREYRRIYNGFFPNSPSTIYLEKFIQLQGKNKNFNINLYVSHDEKLVDILLKIVDNEMVANYVIEFIRNIEFSISISQTSHKEIENIDDNIAEQRRKNWEKFGKMTPEEKLAAEFGGKDIEEQIAILTKKQQEEEELKMNFDAQFANDNPEFNSINEWNMDNLYEFDDADALFNSGSFEVL
jgi:hypothetical protein